MLGCPCFGRGGEGMEGHVWGVDGEGWGVDGGGLGSRWGAIMGRGAIRMLILGIAQPPIIGFVQNNIRPRTSDPALGKQYLHI